jgi:hypothetical protein
MRFDPSMTSPTTEKNSGIASATRISAWPVADLKRRLLMLPEIRARSRPVRFFPSLRIRPSSESAKVPARF